MQTAAFSILFGRWKFAWKPVELEDGSVAWLRLVHELQPICGLDAAFNGKVVKYTVRLPHCPATVRHFLKMKFVWMERSMKLLIARMFLGWLTLVWFVTAGIGFWFQDHPALDGWSFGRYTVYFPGQFLTWYPVIGERHQWILNYGAAGSLLLAVLVAALCVVKLKRNFSRGDLKSRIGGRREARERGLQ